MLHIILGILKVIGILLGSLILLLLVLLLAVLFSSVRYQAEAEKQADQMNGRIKVSWLFHIIYASFVIDSRGKMDLIIRLFGIPLPIFRKRSNKTAEEGLHEEIREEVQENIGEEVQETIQEEELQETIRENIQEEKVSLFQKLCDKIKKIIRKIRAFFCFLVSLPERIGKTAENLRHAAKKLRQMLARPGEIRELLEKLEMQEVFGNISGYVRYLLRHYAPRRICGYLRLGTGDPMTTAYLAGLCYLILPARADRFLLDPVFDGVVLETQTSFCGHIRMCHLVRVAWQAFRDKKLRRAFRYWKKHGNK